MFLKALIAMESVCLCLYSNVPMPLVHMNINIETMIPLELRKHVLLVSSIHELDNTLYVCVNLFELNACLSYIRNNLKHLILW